MKPALVGSNESLRRFLPAALFTCVVVLYNRFPLTYPDTGNYLDNAYALAHGQRPWFFFRPLTYGAFLAPFARPHLLWLVPLLQGYLVAWAADLALRSAAVWLGTRAFLGLFAGLSVGTSLSWVSGQLMPDVFTSIVILLSFVMLWGDARLRRHERWLATALLGFAIATHLSHLPLYALLLAVGLLASGRVIGVSDTRRRRLPLALGAAVPLLLALGLVMAPNYWLYGEPVLSRSSALFSLARLVGDGAAQRYLDRACLVRHYVLCADRASLRPDVDWFLWDAAGPRARYESALQHGDSTFLREAPDIVAGTLRQQWPFVVRASLRNTADQLLTFGLYPGELSFSPTVERATERLGPTTLEAYRRSGQVRRTLPLAAANLVQYTVAGLSVLLLLGCLPALRGPTHRPLRALVTIVGAGVALHAMVIATLAAVHPRYQSRVVWLLPLIAAVAAHQVVETRARRRSPAAGSRPPDP